MHVNKIIYAQFSFPALESELCAAEFLKGFANAENDCFRPQQTFWISRHILVLVLLRPMDGQ